MHDPRPVLLRAALDAAGRGWPVIPLRPGTKRPALHGENACPRTGECATGHRKWETRATTDPARIRAAWAHAPYNVGIATGPASLLVVDLDKPKNNEGASCGATNFKALCERAGYAVPYTYWVRTAGGGTHLYFTVPPGVRLTNTAKTIAPLVDTRAWGGQVVAAGSITPAGPYEALSAPEAAPLPAWLQTILTPAPGAPQGPSGPVAGRKRRYADVALANETRNVESATEGSRDTTLLRAARALGRLIASGDLARSVVEDALQGAGEAAGLPAHQCRSTIRSALNWSIARNTADRAAA
ncbi:MULTISPECIES: bifunctional DNA primase/polymerase [Streptomyces]|uniref:DNA primase n=1 Tax=Streptomyces tsukubensis (strain DSM 42081 / NBRC 108919 / NRRL 18488 / 9993) TaxID=1114943 RepID=I2N0W9_STRT9|nr:MULTISPECIES: bifunctional DNA primase/polymerase [Streptomyces]AZK94849.1 DNA primase [Streptomyces tsukubensis]EIF90666.1 hypothetical protein [Streptomyces tsukubensis NRRL18488]MYS66981.1 DNA primase [Streptomyces sp. SID5473]QKM69068.1 DNA primase [Streptomyces tsukubensis NRRL18488]TAI40709.1 DNA primase [Streptomyces tsukubensis]